MSGAVSTPGRVVRRTRCAAHGVEFGQVLDPGVPGQRQAEWLPPQCPQCEKELREKILATEELERQTEEIDAETDRRCAADAERAERIRVAVEVDMAEEVAKLLTEFYAMRRGEYEIWHENEDWQRIAAEVKEEKRTEISEQLRKAG